MSTPTSTATTTSQPTIGTEVLAELAALRAIAEAARAFVQPAATRDELGERLKALCGALAALEAESAGDTSR